MSKKRQYSPNEIAAIMDYTLLVKLWAQGKISPRYMTKTQLRVIKNFVKKDIPWAQLTGSN